MAGSAVNLPANAGDSGDAHSIPGLERFPTEKSGNHSSIILWWHVSSIIEYDTSLMNWVNINKKKKHAKLAYLIKVCYKEYFSCKGRATFILNN